MIVLWEGEPNVLPHNRLLLLESVTSAIIKLCMQVVPQATMADRRTSET